MEAKYIMKCDDDTFVRIDAVMKQVKKVQNGRSLYVGNINYYHKPLRHGKWGVSYEVYFSFYFLGFARFRGLNTVDSYCFH